MELRTMQERELLALMQGLFPGVKWRFGTKCRLFAIMNIGTVLVKRSGKVKWLNNVWETPEDFYSWINVLKEDIENITSQPMDSSGTENITSAHNGDKP